jgi:hypothetical protein
MIAGTVALKGPHGSRLKDRIRSSAAETRWHAPPELGRPRRTRMATRAPYDLKSPPTPSAWARLLALPEVTGARRISRNLKWLSNEHFIALDPRPGRPASITLLDAGGSGGQYIRPMEKGRYVGMPVELWT